MCSNKSAIGKRQSQKARDLALRRHPLQKALARHRRLVRHLLVKGQLIQVGTRRADLAIANLTHRRTVTPSSQAVFDELAQVGLLVAHHDVDLDLVGHKGPLGHKAFVVALVSLGRGA